MAFRSLNINSKSVEFCLSSLIELVSMKELVTFLCIYLFVIGLSLPSRICETLYSGHHHSTRLLSLSSFIDVVWQTLSPFIQWHTRLYVVVLRVECCAKCYWKKKRIHKIFCTKFASVTGFAIQDGVQSRFWITGLFVKVSKASELQSYKFANTFIFWRY